MRTHISKHKIQKKETMVTLSIYSDYVSSEVFNPLNMAQYSRSHDKSFYIYEQFPTASTVS